MNWKFKGRINGNTRIPNQIYPVLRMSVLVGFIALQACSGETSDSNSVDIDATGVSTGQTKAALSTWPSGEEAAGATVLIRGEDFSGDCSVRVSLDGDVKQPLGEADTTTEGAFSVQAVIPSDTDTGMHTLTAQGLAGPDCDEPSDNLATTDIDVKAPLPSLLIDTIEGRPGGTIQVSGRGFCGDPTCSAITLFADGSVAAADVEVATDGSFSVTALVPAVDNAGEIMVVAVQTDASGEMLRGFGDLFVTVRPGGERPVIL